MKRIKLTSAMRDQLIGALRAGADVAMAARAVGVSRRTVYNWREKDQELAEAMDEARAFADDVVVRRLFDMTTENVTACIWWLKNRRPNEWRDRQEMIAKHDVTVAQAEVTLDLSDPDDEKTVSEILAERGQPRVNGNGHP